MNKFVHTRLAVALCFIWGICACSTTGDQQTIQKSSATQALTGKFVWHDLITDDVAAVRRFYGSLLGWRFKDTTHPNGGQYTLILSGDQLVGGIVQLDDPQGIEYSRWLGYLSVPDVDRAVAETRSAGGRAVVSPLDLPGVGRAAAVIDPQGAVVGLLHRDSGDPADPAKSTAGSIVWNEMLAADDRAAAEFYAQITDAQSAAIERRGGVYFMLRAQGRDQAGIMRRPDAAVAPFWLTHFAVTDPAATAEKAAGLGGEVILPPSPDLREGTVAVVIDPTGAILALQKLSD
jgi:predicted enzyme related to lactoylglutathione lyase